MSALSCRAAACRLFGAMMAALLFGACARVDPGPEAVPESSYLFVWAGDKDQQQSDFLAVIDARPSSPDYGRVVATLPVGARGTMPHHTEYEYPADDLLFMNGWLSGETFVADLRDPRTPKLAARFKDLGGFSYPHSFARLPDGHVLATFQGRDGRYGAPGGLVEIDAEGGFVRAASAQAPEIPDGQVWPYSLALTRSGERAIVAFSEMGMPPFEEFTRTNHVQVWNTRDLSLVASVALPAQDGGEFHLDPAEPRVLEDGSVYVGTFSCGLYRIDGVDGASPTARFVHAFPGGTTLHNACMVPVVVGRYWVQVVPEINGLIVLDTRDPAAPLEVARLTLDDRYPMPHWIAADRKSSRLVLTGMDESWVLVLRIDMKTGQLTVEEGFRDAEAAFPGVDFARALWPHGESGAAIVHGAVFGG